MMLAKIKKTEKSCINNVFSEENMMLSRKINQCKSAHFGYNEK